MRERKSWTWTLAGICPICYYWRLLSLAGLSMIAVVRNQRYHCWNKARLWNSYHLYLSLILLTILSDNMLLEDKQQFKFGIVMTGISTSFLVLLLVVKWPRQAQIRRKTYKSKKKHQDRVQDPKSEENQHSIAARWLPSWHFLGFFMSFRILDSVMMFFLGFVGFPSYLGLSWSFYY